MRKYALIASMCILAVCFGSPVHSSIGANHIKASVAEEPFDNPYVTDGLVVTWDAIWNVGFGKHDPNGGIVECMSNTPTYVRRGSYVVNDDCLTCEGVVIATQPIAQMLNKFADSQQLTIEAVCLLKQGRGVCMVKSRPFIIDFWSNGGAYMVVEYPENNRFTSKWGTGFQANARMSRTVTISQDVMQWWINGIAETSTERPEDLQMVIYNNPFSIFGADWQFILPSTGEFCALRIYNRALTPEEIAHNYNIDKERFGL